MGIERYRFKLEQRRGRKNQIETYLEEVSSSINKLLKKQRNILEGIEIIKLIAKQTQQQIDNEITSVISLALSIIYDIPYEFHFDFHYRGGKTVVEPIFTKYGKSFRPGRETGIGPVDVATLALRIAIWNLIEVSPVIILDEPSRNLDSDAIIKMETLLQTLSDEFGLQFIIISHEKELIQNASVIFSVKQIDKVSQVTEIQRINKKELEDDNI